MIALTQLPTSCASDEEISRDQIGPIEADKPVEEVRQNPYPLPKEFEWVLVDVLDEGEVHIRILCILLYMQLTVSIGNHSSRICTHC
jgi:hypothetical protein